MFAVSQSAFDLPFGLLEKNHWSYTAPSFDTYKKEKGLHLRREVSNIATFTPPVDNVFHQTTAYDRRRTFLYKPRIASIVGGDKNHVLRIFPGTSPVLWQLDRTANSNSSPPAKHSAYQTFILLTRFQTTVATENGQSADSTPSTTNDWHWTCIPRPRLIEIGNSLAPQIHTESLLPLKSKASQFVRSFRNRGTAAISLLHELFTMVRHAWCGSGNSDYDPAIVWELCSILGRHSHNTSHLSVLELAFELEMLASYGTFLTRVRPLASGSFANYWLDVGAMNTGSIRGTERCQTKRLFDELKNLAYGRIAPLLVNEYGCVADGNHRLTAAWVWNILHFCQPNVWSLSDHSFQRAVGTFVTHHLTNTTTASLHEALRCLALFLSDSSCTTALSELRHSICRVAFEELPVVPLLEYCALAVSGSEYENNLYRRFEPLIYQELVNSNSGILPARACYHFADMVPLPWFSLSTDMK